MTARLLRFADLAERGIVRNWPQLRRLVEKNGFPPGRMLGENSRFWTEIEIDEWLAARPLAGHREEAA
ncbi:AlpA family phage regulatory protein [Mesorhizobium sp. WSM4313]|uniref:helix-turn-helix transcriptional regulator n=1 Tax=Mesorhizobium sp. WSM4313 TaxID=2029412 RepID=UPI000BB057E2|nr:AlpA family phage regulatory protein [Mesorhizobium sp. WSM4313]PBB21146.1 DNA-binding protein [Mesorhizobium sp. WSM4313]